MDVMEIIDQANKAMEEYVASPSCKQVRASDCGLSVSCGRFYMTTNGEIIVELRKDNALQYWGGFEYVQEGSRTVVGKWVVYADDKRVGDCFDTFEEMEE